MGQYFQIINLDKKEKLHPHAFGDGLKLMEFATSGNGVMTGLALLLRQSSQSGGGDFNVGLSNDLLGSWAGDRVSIFGDYDDSDLYFDGEYKDISKEVVKMCKLDPYVKETIENSFYAGMKPTMRVVDA